MFLLLGVDAKLSLLNRVFSKVFSSLAVKFSVLKNTNTCLNNFRCNKRNMAALDKKNTSACSSHGGGDVKGAVPPRCGAVPPPVFYS